MSLNAPKITLENSANTQPTEFMVPRITSGTPMFSSVNRCGSSTADPEVPATIQISEKSTKPTPNRHFSVDVSLRPLSGAISPNTAVLGSRDAFAVMIPPLEACSFLKYCNDLKYTMKKAFFHFWYDCSPADADFYSASASAGLSFIRFHTIPYDYSAICR